MPVLNVTNNGLRHFITAPQVGIAVETDGIIVKVKVISKDYFPFAS